MRQQKGGVASQRVGENGGAIGAVPEECIDSALESLGSVSVSRVSFSNFSSSSESLIPRAMSAAVQAT
jgi:hypothetical protein